MGFKWHQSLPWIQFQLKVKSKFISCFELVSVTPVTVTTPQERMENVKLTASLLTPIRLEDFGSLQSRMSVSSLASRIGSIMPESCKGENFGRAEKLARGSSNEARQEHINIAIFKLSNKLDTNLDWEQTLKLLETSRIMSARGQLSQSPDSPRTVSALAEVLFQDAFKFLYDERLYEAPRNLQSRTIKLITWLLRRGFRSDKPISLVLPPRHPPTPTSFNIKTTGLQIAIFCENYELACALLDARADPNVLGHHIYPYNGDYLVVFPPFSIAISRVKSPGRDAVIRRLSAAGADIRAEQERERGFLVTVSTLSTLAGFGDDGVEMQEIIDILHIGQAEFVTADVLICAAWNGQMKNLELLLQISPDVNMTNPLGLTALHAAAYQGNEDICKMLLRRGSSVDYPDQGAPSPLHLAAYRHHVSIVAMLHQHGASLLRGIRITEHNYELVSSRYFLNVFHDFEYGLEIEPWVEVKQVASLLESPIGGAAVYDSDVRGNDTITYLVQHGVKSPTSTDLESALRQNLNRDDGGPVDYTPLQAALIACSVLDKEKSAPIQRASDLLDAGAMVVGGEAILALRKLGSWDLVERILSSDHDDVAERYDLIPYWRTSGLRIGATLLETAILGRSETFIGYVLARNPSEYSAGALCAACLLVAKQGNTLALVERLLKNRANIPATHQKDVECETTAVGIAAWSGNTAMLEMLHAYIPVSHLAYLPNGDPSVKLATGVVNPLGEPGSRSLSFWHAACFDERSHLMGSPVNFALDKPKILDQLLRHGHMLDRISLVIMADSGNTSTTRSLVQDRDILQNEYASHLHAPLYHAIINGHLEMSTLLLELGEDINDNEDRILNSPCAGRNPLAIAIEMNDLPLIEMLLKAGADVNVLPSWYKGRTALQCAAAQGSLGIARQLVDLGADIDAGGSNFDGRTALEAAAEYGRIDMVQFLLSEGVETTGKGRYQYVAAIARAELRGHYVTANILKEHRPWTEEDQSLSQSEDLLDPDAEWRWETDDDEGSSMASACGEKANGTAGHSVLGDSETFKENDGIDWDSSYSIALNAPLANGPPDLMSQDMIAEPGFAIEGVSMDGYAIDWDALHGFNFFDEDMMAEPGFVIGEEVADLWF